jgi:hypothetical protein
MGLIMATLKDLLDSGMSRDEINALLSQSTMTSPGFNASTFNSDGSNPQPSQVQPPQLPRNYVQMGNNAPIDMDQRQPMPQNFFQRGNNAPVDLGQSQRQHDVWADGPEVLRREQMPDGRTLITERVAAMADGRQSAGMRQRIETPDYMNPANLARMKYQEAQQKLAGGDVDNQHKRAQLMELMGQDPSQMAQGGAISTPQMSPQGAVQGGQPVSSQELAGQVNAARQKFLSRRFGTPPTGHRWDEAGNAVSIPGVEKPLTEFQGKSSGFGLRAATAHEQLNALEGGGLGGEFDSFPGYRNGPVQPGAIKRAAEAFPSLGMDFNQSLGTMMNFTQSAAQQRVDQAQRNFVNATLRQESGAAISDGEWDNAKKQYFPQPGEDASVIEQKRLNRAQVIGGFKTSAGRDGAAPIAPAQSSMRESLQQEMAARAEAIDVIKANPAARAEVIKRMQAAKYSTKGL